MRSLDQCLLDTHLPRLQAIARFWDVELTTSHPREAATQLAKAMAVPQTIADAWNALSDDHRQALGTLLDAGGQMPLRIFTRQWGEIRTMGPGRIEREQPWHAPISPAEGLWYKGFISRAFDPKARETYEAVFVPPELYTELRAHLSTSSTPSPDISLKPTTKPSTIHSASEIFLDDVCTMLAYLQNEQVRPSPDGDWPARHKANLAPQMHNPDPARLTLLYHMIQNLGWLRSVATKQKTGHTILRPDPGPVTTWLQSPTNQQQSTLAKAWQNDPTWNDLFHVPSIHPEDTGAWRNDPLLARKTILNHLKECLPNTWYKLDDLIAVIKQTTPDFQRPSGDYTIWYIRDTTTGTYLSGFENWNKVEGALIRYIITGPLAWLGLIDFGTLVPGKLSISFRLTSAGAEFLDLVKPSSDQEPVTLTLQPDFTVLVPSARRYERFQLARVADWMRTGAPFIYRLTPTSLKRARQQGIPIARVLEFLGQVTDAPVPRFVEAALTRWDARGTEAQLERELLLRISSEELMTQITSSPRTRRLIREQISPTVALVHERDWSRLIVALGEMGLLTDVTLAEK
ncbi:MAG: hypothetical protein GY832_39815 [Chloroflexi bacterium]|nr:hypothetical protein [Chloroflexota bacterium]